MKMEAIKKIGGNQVALSSVSFVVLTLGLGIPIWLETTTVKRYPLPYDEIQGLPHPNSLQLEYTVCDESGKSITLPAPTKTSKLLFTTSSTCDIKTHISSAHTSPTLSSIDTLTIPKNTPAATQSDYLANILTPNLQINSKLTQTVVISIMTSSLLDSDSFSKVAETVKDRLDSEWEGLIQFKIIVEILRYDEKLFDGGTLEQSFNYLESNTMSPDSEKHTYHLAIVLAGDSIHEQYHVENWGTLRFANTLANVDEIVARSFKTFLGLDVTQLTKPETHMLLINSAIHRNYAAAHHQLISLVAMLDKVKNIVIKQDVAEKIARSVTLLQTVRQASTIDKVRLYENILNAHSLAVAAATDDSLLGLLYFPEDQKFGIYVPLFLPAMMSILGGMKALKEFVKPRLD